MNASYLVRGIVVAAFCLPIGFAGTALGQTGARAEPASEPEQARAQRALETVLKAQPGAKALVSGDARSLTALYRQAGGDGTVTLPQGIQKWPKIHLKICWERRKSDGTITIICIEAGASAAVTVGKLTPVRS